MPELLRRQLLWPKSVGLVTRELSPQPFTKTLCVVKARRISSPPPSA